jgi:hypothetical protein
LDFLINQENIKEISPPYLYYLVEKIIKDSKSSVRSLPEVSFSRLFEKHRIESYINQLLNKIPKEQGQVSEIFVESMIY